MTGFFIHPHTYPGIVSLTVTNLARSLDFYQNVLGFKLNQQDGDTASLGAGGPDLILLRGNPEAKRSPRSTGLYHFAVLVPTRLDLAFVLHSIVETKTPVTGFADHLVSEAVYLPDPDGSGIEIYRDRPRDTWRDSSGELRMGTDPLDVEGLLAELEDHDSTWSGLPNGTRLGHIHLHVADLESAIRFYRDALGFDLLMRYGPSAAFLSAGGYHHHIGINTWNGTGAPQPPPDSIGLRHFNLHLPDTASLGALQDHLEQSGISLEKSGSGIWLHDPSSNRILLRAKTG
jgi:catechol 2,3-dioxygenase